eukprot:4070347-Pyramimonas_sp.AAC.1
MKERERERKAERDERDGERMSRRMEEETADCLCSLPGLCPEGLLLSSLKGPGSGPRPGRFPWSPGSGSPSPLG